MILVLFIASVLSQGTLPTTTVSTCGWFFGTIGGGTSVRYCGTSCGVAGAPASATPICPPQAGDPIDTQVRWGQSVTSGNPFAQSGMGFTGEQNKEVPLNREWFCGRLTHFNNPIIGPASSTRLGLQLRIPEFNVNSNFDFRLVIDETTNSEANGPCPYPSTVPCSDKITFDLAGLDFKKSFKIGLVDYTLQLTGFKESRVSTSFPTENFISNENRENNAFLFARIVAACPETCVGGGMVDLVVENGLKTCGCKCGAVTCTPPQELQKDCSCKCPVGTCNGAPTDSKCGCKCPTPQSAGQTCAVPKTGWDSAKCECKCDDGLCGSGTLVDPGSCKCDCAQVKCTNGRVANPKKQCACECLAVCGPTQNLITDNGKCECQCNPLMTKCANGFKLEIDPTNPAACRCGCENLCGAGCGMAGSVKQCSEGPNEPCCQSCQFKPLPCDDKNKCTKDDVCDPVASLMGGKSVCKGVPSCPTAPDTCTQFTCDPATGACNKKTEMDGAACGPTGSDPKNWDRCSFQCSGGQCVGKTVSCDMPVMMPTAADLASCTGYSCNPATGMCDAGPKPGKPCNDGDQCTLNDVCKQVGTDVVCQGDLNDCQNEQAPQCHSLKCNHLIGVCEKVPLPFNTECFGDGTDACKTNGVCSGGVCLFKRKCPDLEKESGYCNENTCDKQTGQCKLSPRPSGSACILPNGRPRDTDFCGQNYTCQLNGTQGMCKGDIKEDKVNISECNPGLVIDTGAGQNAALIVGLASAGAVLVMIIVAVLLCAFVNKSQLTDPSTWGMGADVAVQNSPMYDQSAGGQQNRLYEGR